MDAPTQESDEVLIKAVLGGRREVYLSLVDRYQDRLRLALGYCCFSDDELEEYLQEAFVTAFEKLHQFDPTSDFYAWLKTIALNALRMEIRRRETHRRHSDRYLRHLLIREVEDPVQLDQSEARGIALARCIEKLPPDQAELLARRYRADLNVAQLAAAFGVQVGTIKTRLCRLRQTLRDCVNTRLAGGGT